MISTLITSTLLIIQKILILFLIMILSQVIHETSHYIEARKQGRWAKITFGIGKCILIYKDLVIRLIPIVGRVETSVDWLKNKTRFFMAGGIGQIIFSIIFLIVGYCLNIQSLLNLSLLFFIYGVINFIPYFPYTDMFCLLRCKDEFNDWYFGIEDVKLGIWIFVGGIFSFVFFAIISWIIMFQK